MQRWSVIFLGTSILWILGWMPQSGKEILRRAEEKLKGKTSEGVLEMEIIKPDFRRTLKLRSWWVGNQKALIEIIEPPREAGNKTLKVGSNLWMYLRNTETTIRIPPSMMLQSWNGSDFTYDDLVRESNLPRDYEVQSSADVETTAYPQTQCAGCMGQNSLLGAPEGLFASKSGVL